MGKRRAALGPQRVRLVEDLRNPALFRKYIVPVLDEIRG